MIRSSAAASNIAAQPSADSGDREVEPPPGVPAELVELRARIRSMSPEVRAQLEPLAEDACEQALFRGRALSLAREALEQFRLELSAAQFDLDATRREREGLRRWADRGF